MTEHSFPISILVTGASGQLGSELKDLSKSFPDFKFIFAGKQELSIINKDAIQKFFDTHKIDFCINCAAYTAVDKAESEKETAYLVNDTAVGHLAAICSSHKTKLIHISTDYVYDGSEKQPLKESDKTGPLNEYGKSKLRGEESALSKNPETLIIRTSWVYSYYGHNFVKTMIRLLKEKKELNVVNDQIGSPTNAADLAFVIMQIIKLHLEGKKIKGILNYSNTGETSWFQFAQFIKEQTGSQCEIHPVTTAQYATPATRPEYSVLDTTLIKSLTGIKIPFWKDSASACIHRLIKN